MLPKLWVYVFPGTGVWVGERGGGEASPLVVGRARN